MTATEASDGSVQDGQVRGGLRPPQVAFPPVRSRVPAAVAAVALAGWAALAFVVHGDRTVLAVDRALAGPAGRVATALDPGGPIASALAGRTVLAPAAVVAAALLAGAMRLGDRRARWLALTGPVVAPLVAVAARPVVDRGAGSLFSFPSVPVCVAATLSTLAVVLARWPRRAVAAAPARPGRAGSRGRSRAAVAGGVLLGTALTALVAAAVVGRGGVVVTDVLGGVLLGLGVTATLTAVIVRWMPPGRPLVPSRLVRGLTLLVVASSVWLAGVVPFAYFLLSPGSLIDLDRAVSVTPPGGVEAGAGASLHGTYSGLTVRTSTLTLGRWVRHELTGSIDEIVPRVAVIPAGQGTEEHRRIEQQAFVDASTVAVSVAQKAAGEDVTTLGDGALITGVVPGAPADGVLQPGDVVVELAGRPLATEDDLRSALIAATADAGIDPAPLEAGAPDPAAGRTVPVTLVVRGADGVVRTEQAVLRRLERSGRFGLGIGVATANLRFVTGPSATSIRVDGGKVGGPSAGLLTALAVYDVLVPEDLAGGRHITGTGTLSANGTVGRIGGIEEKVRAARAAGADLFLAPAAQVAQAEAAASGRMRVVGVATFAEAVAALSAG